LGSEWFFCFECIHFYVERLAVAFLSIWIQKRVLGSKIW
jgi:hypothetical protein